MRSSSPGRSATWVIGLCVAAMCAAVGPALAQKSYDDHEPTDRFYITIGGFSQNDIKTTLRLDAKAPSGGIAVGGLVALEQLFDVDDQVTTARLDGWYRFNKKHRIAWTYWRTRREGISTYNGDPIDIGDITIDNNNFISVDDESQLIALSWGYSFLNTSKYEAWLGAGLNFQRLNTTIDVNVAGVIGQRQESLKGTVPIPVINFGGRWNFSKRWRMLLTNQFFGLKIGDYEGRLEDTRVLAEVNLIKNFGIGGGFERFNLEVEAENEDFIGQLDVSYTAFTLYLKGQF